MSSSLSQQSIKRTRRQAFLENPIVRIVTASLVVALVVAIPLILIQATIEKSMRQFWPQILCGAFCVTAYIYYVRLSERRVATELSFRGAFRESAVGMIIGAAMFFAVLIIMLSTGVIQVVGTHTWVSLVGPFSELILVSFFEEILFRGIIFRLVEKSFGTRKSLIVSALLFSAAHLPNAGFSVLAFAVTVVAGLMFCAAYMQTRRLWLPIGIHFSWNFLSDGVFSLPTSGHLSKGLLQVQVSGPGWLSGGAYGIEGSIWTLFVISLTSFYLLRRASLLESNTSITS